MKKIILLGLAFVLSLVSVSQQNITEGKIITKQSIKSDNAQVQAQLDMMGDIVATTYFKANKSRAEMSNPMTGDITVISDAETMTTLTLMDGMMGKKYMTNTTKIDDEILKGVKIEQGTEVKTILGYHCLEQLVTINQDGVELKMKMFTTEKIAPVFTKETLMLGDKLKGFVMYMEMAMNQQGMDMTVITEVTELQKEDVSDDIFDLTPPEGYTKLEGM